MDKSAKLKVIQFILVGGGATFVHIVIYSFLIRYDLANPQFSNAFGFLVAFFVSFIGHTKHTFSHVETKRSTSFNKFVITAAIGYIFNAMWVFIIENVFSIDPLWSIVGIGFLTPILTFIILNKWVFRK
jgi:putative flippase GtrA